MQWDAVGAGAELAGAAAVLITIVYFARQLKQGSSNFRAASFQSASQGRTAFRMAIVTDENLMRIFTTGLRDPSELTELERIRFHVILVEELRIAQSAFFLQKRGLADPEYWVHEKHMIDTYRVANGFNEWWSQSKDYYAPEFVEYVDSAEAKNSFGAEMYRTEE